MAASVFAVGGASIVIVDDSFATAEICKAWLETDGHTVEVVSNPLLAPMVVQKSSPDLVLIDVEMPTVKGPRVVGILRNVAPDAKLILHSSLDVEELSATAQDSRADGFISKTESPHSFRNSVNYFLANTA